jgi:HAD superfamily hydrolase (TIGR01490 family)
VAGIDFFDVDHTVTRGSTGRHYVVLGVRIGLFPRRNLLTIPLFYMQYRYGTMTGNKPFQRDFPGLEGTPRTYLEDVAVRCFEEKLRPDVYEEAATLIRQRQEQGRRVVFATSSIDIIVEPLANWLGVELIASSLEFVDERCTGRFRGAPVFRAEKRRRVLEIIQRSSLEPRDCSFFSDSIHDLPLLDSVGEPIAVNPDRRLKRIARQRGWPILRFDNRTG